MLADPTFEFMGNKVYILFGDVIDERPVHAVFSTRAAADAAIHLAGEDAVIEEYEMDGPLPEAPEGRSIWSVSDYGGFLAVRLTVFYMDEDDRKLIDEVVFDDGSFQVRLWATNEEQALQLGIEKIEHFKAQQGVQG